jgi:hypothetical protein
MANSVNSKSTNISASLLPGIYRTDTNKKFLQATVEQLTQRGTVSKINGYIGRQNAKATNGNDVFIEAADPTRQNYQLEPSMVINDQQGNNIFFKDYQDYINQLSVFGSNVSNHSRLNKSEIYSWDPQIDWDKFVNFQQYHWLPEGPSVITIDDAVENIIGQQSYNITSSVLLSNGMLIRLSDNIEYYVEGVGTSIKLIEFSVFSEYSSSEHDYVVINRASVEQSPWVLGNNWVHADVIKTSLQLNGLIPDIDNSTRAKRPIIEFNANLGLYNYGYNRIDNVDFYDTLTTDAFSTVEGSTGYYIDKVGLKPGDRVIFSVDTDATVRNNVYEIKLVKSKIHLRLVHTATMHDVVKIKNGIENSISTIVNKQLWFDGMSWQIAQKKTSLHQSPLFDVFDENGNSFGDNSVYLGTTFVGNKIFSYAAGTNGSVDPVLGFILTYKPINNIGDIIFNFNFATDTFKYSESSAVKTYSVSSGFLKKIANDGSATYSSGWKKCELSNTQAAVRIYKNLNIVNDFNLDIYDDINQLTDLEIRIYVNGVRLNKTNGTINNWSIIDGPLYKKIRFNTDLLLTDILTVRSFSKQPINTNGYYELPLNLQNNPQNQSIGSMALSEVLDHVDSIVDNLGTQFVGEIPGYNNLRDLPNISSYGTKFVKHGCPFELSLFHITSSSTNVIRALEKAREDYNKFKRTFISVAETLGIDTDVKTHVDMILTHINKNTPVTSPYYFSDMVPYGPSIKTEFEVIDYRITQYPMTTIFTLNELSNKAVGVYVNNAQLIYGSDYIFNSQGFVDIKSSLNTGDVVTIYEYENTDGCFIPETLTKLGIWPKYVPSIYEDTTLINPVNMIQGHDGSMVLAYDDYRDALLLELETRIYNNIKIEYDPTIFDINDIIPRYGVENDYSLAEFNSILESSFYKWTSLIDVDFTKVIGYDSTNPYTFNYYGYSTPDNKSVPGYWRGIYKWLYGTDRPNMCPWEMLGLTIKPEWWENTYGVAPYTSDNLVMWDDIGNGLLKTPGSEKVISKYIRTYLTNHLPVDNIGELVNPLATGLLSGIVSNDTKNNFVFGDVSPVESAWRRSSYFPFSVLITSILLTPTNTIGVTLDRSRILRNVVGELIYKDTKHATSSKDIILPSVYSSETTVRTSGIINYIVNYIVSSDLTTYDQYIYDLSNIGFVLSYRVGAFTSKEKFKLLLDSSSPLITGSVFVPQEDYSIILNSSSPTKKITYSGVIITNSINGYSVKGYSNTQPYFTYYPWISSGSVVNVGGISESYVIWTENQQYTIGQVIKVGNSYYRVVTGFRSTSIFDNSNLQLLSGLPIVGGRDAFFRKAWDRDNPITIPYNTSFDTEQQVVDFILGYGEWLSDQGFVFDEFNNELNQVVNWRTSAKEFLFWTTQNWSTGKDLWTEWVPNTSYPINSIVQYFGNYYSAIQNIPSSSTFDYDLYEPMYGLSSVGSSVISLSPAADKITFSTNINVVDDIANQFNDYEIFRVDGQPISPTELSSSRDNNLVSYSPRNDNGIYSASFYLVQKEHVVLLNNTTLFKDLIYDPISGYKQNRIKISAHVSTNWYGGLDLPGFIFDEATILTWEPWKSYALGDIVQYQSLYYSADSFITGSELFNTAEWNILSAKPATKILPNWTNVATQFVEFYSMDIESFNNSQQNLAQHLIGYQKRQYLENIIKDDISEFKFYQGMIIDKGTQNVFNKLFDATAGSLKFYEEWAIREGQYGSSSAFDEIEFTLNQSDIINNPQWYNLTNKKDPLLSDYVHQITPDEVYLRPIGYDSNPWVTVTGNNRVLRTPGFVRETDVLATVSDLSGLLSHNIELFDEGSYVWCTFENTSWNVYRFTNTNLSVIDAMTDNAAEYLTIICSTPITEFVIGDYIGIKGIDKFSKFFKVISVSDDTLVVAASGVKIIQPFEQQSTAIIYKFVSHRISSINNAPSILPAVLKPNELIWSDDDGNGKWASWQHSAIYSGTMISNPYKDTKSNFGRAIAYSKNNLIMAVSTTNGEIYVYDVIRRLSQVISRPFISHNDINKLITFGSTIAVSDDGQWLVIGSPMVGQAASIDNQQEPSVDNHVVMKSFVNSSYSNQGVVSIYGKDVRGKYYIKNTFTSPEPSDNEYFGSAIEFSGNTLYVGAAGNSNKAGKVYSLNYNATVHVETSFNVIGNNETSIKVASTDGIEFGMYIVGTGFNSNQYVSSVDIDGYSLTISAPPDTQPSGILQFVTYGWEHSNVNYSVPNTSNFGSSIIATEDTTTIVIASNGNVYVYKNNTLFQTITKPSPSFGRSIAVSDTGEYIAISDMLALDEFVHEGSVYIYKLQGNSYVEYQKILNRSPVVNEQFGTNIAFMNDYATLVIYSGDTDNPYGRVEIYDRYASEWIYAERLSPLTFQAGKFISGNSYTIISVGSTDFTTIGAYSNLVGESFVATGSGSGSGVASLYLGNTSIKQAGSFDKGNTYTIVSIGNTDFTAIGAASNTVGTVFIASDIGSGTGTASFNLGFAVSTNRIAIGEPVDADKKTNTQFIESGLVFEYKKPTDSYSWIKKYSELDKPDISKIKKAFLYNKVTNKFVKYVDIIDPIQGKIPGPAAQELTYRTFTDPAVYSVVESSLLSSVDYDAESAWTTAQTGQLWWDLRTTKFVECYDDEIMYRANNWNTLAHGASIDIYEWVESDVLPSVWDIQADTATGLALGISGTSLYGNTVYSIRQTYDNISKTTKNTYYFWVKNKTTVPNNSSRTISSASIAGLITNPSAYGYQHISITGGNSFMISNMARLLNKDDIVLSIQYWLVDNKNFNTHSQWRLISNDITTIIPDRIQTKWIDSLCGSDLKGRLVPDTSLPPKLLYGVENRPRQSMFVNRFEALKQIIEHVNLVLEKNQISTTKDLTMLQSFDAAANVSANLYDIEVDTELDLTFVNSSIFKKPALSPYIIDGKIIGVEIINSGVGYQNSPMVEVIGSGVGAIISTNLNSKGQIISCNIVNGGYGYTDETSLIVRNYAVLVNSDAESNGSWCLYSYDPDKDLLTRSLVKSYDTTKYWYYVDWYLSGYSKFTVINYIVNLIDDIQQIGVQAGDIVKIKTNSSGEWTIIRIDSVVNYIQYTTVGIQNGTIQLSSGLYESAQYDSSFYASAGYDNYPTTELRIILESLKNDIFVDDLYSEYLNLFFSSVRYALSEQNYLDWIFKTSFIKAKHTASPLHQPVTYRNDNLSDFEKYVSEVKPYRTQVREYISTYNGLDNSNTMVSDFDLPSVITDGVNTPINITIVDGEIRSDNAVVNQYPWKSWLDNVGFQIVDILISIPGNNYDEAPTVLIESDSGSGATAIATVEGGRVTNITITNPGSGYITTPRVVIQQSPTGASAVATAILGNSVVRTSKIKMKFDRINYDYVLNTLEESETFIGNGLQTTFPLKWSPDIRNGYTVIKIDGIVIFSHQFTISKVETPVEYEYYTQHTGEIVFNEAPLLNSIIEVMYTKDSEILTETDRIQFYYNTKVGELGKELPQLLTGIDYAGVIVDGISFDINKGWNSLAYNSGRWNSYDPNFTDYTKTISVDDITNNTDHEILLPYIPTIGELLTIYKNEIRLDDLLFSTPDQINVDAIMQTPQVMAESTDSVVINQDGSVTIVLPSSLSVVVNDVFVVRKFDSDGSVSPDYEDIDTVLLGGNLPYTTATGYAPSDIIVDGDGFVTPTTSPAPEELIAGQLIDTLSIKVTQPGIGYRQFKDMLNKTRYTVLNADKKTTLAAPLRWYDTEIYVNDPSVLDEPSPANNQPGVIEIGSERIEYFVINNNALSQLRRATLGTGARTEYVIGTDVQNIGYSQEIIYSDNTITKTIIVSDDSNLIDLDFIPRKSLFDRDIWANDPFRPSTFETSIPPEYGQTNDIELFVGGYTHTQWESDTIYYTDQIITHNGFLYRINAKHLSGEGFEEQVSLLDLNDDVIEENVPYNTVYSIFDISSNTAWMVNTIYDVNQIVYHNSQLYRIKSRHRSGSTFESDVTTLALDETVISEGVKASAVREICGNQSRLKKSPYIMHDQNVSLYSPTGDVYFDADFSVDGVNKQVRLTHKLPVGTIITIVKQTGVEWNNQYTI